MCAEYLGEKNNMMPSFSHTSQLSTSHLPSLDMASNTSASSDTGGPGPSIHFEEAGYESKYKPEAPFSSLSSSAKKEMEYLRRELEDSRQRINRDTEVINSLHEKVTALEELVSKQKITISTQSKTISDRRVLRKSQQQQFPMTPNHHHPHVQQYPVSGRNASGIPGAGGASVGGEVNVMHQAPSPFETQTPQSVTSFGSTSQYSTVFDQPPPKFEIPYGVSVQAYNAVVPPSLGRTQDVFGPMAIAVSNGADHGSSTLSVPDNDYRKEMADFSTRFLGLMRLAEIFGQAHASFPNIFMDSHLDGQVKEFLMAISSRSQASVLIGNATTRGFFVAKAINYYLVNNVLTIAVVKGFDPSADLEIGQIEEQLNSRKSSSPFLILTYRFIQ
ncbi:uncharacterized protein BJX67DRAFT_90293 [Aspergillus lucknowensis]|uniref:Uncharacterized protein n=1 Tax=Aspergillus lucknowensis TaxID=176173 RepID=A0ABR4M5I9_9EURO